MVLASPPDMVGLFEKPGNQPNHRRLVGEARRNVKERDPRKLVSSVIWDWYHLSSQTYIDLSKRGGSVDNLPVFRNPEEFKQLSLIDVPILGIMGENDDIAIRTLEEDLGLIAKKAINAASFTKLFVMGANHNYDRVEKDFAEVVLKWLVKQKFVK